MDTFVEVLSKFSGEDASALAATFEWEMCALRGPTSSEILTTGGPKATRASEVPRSGGGGDGDTAPRALIYTL